jgi:hypothetical protein
MMTKKRFVDTTSKRKRRAEIQRPLIDSRLILRLALTNGTAISLD